MTDGPGDAPRNASQRNGRGLRALAAFGSLGRLGRWLSWPLGWLVGLVNRSVGESDENLRGRLRAVPRLAWRPLGGLLGPAASDAGQSLGALAFSAVASLVTGLTFALFTDVLDDYPGLLLFIPAAIGLRGNVFGPLGSRLSTAIRAGTLTWNLRPDSLLGQNVIGAVVSSLAASFGMAVLAELVVQLLRDQRTSVLGIADFVVISVIGGTLASLVVLVITLGLAVASARFGWDLDNVTAPLVSAAGDLITLPALVLVTALVYRGSATWLLAGLATLIVAASVIWLLRSKFETARRILIETVPTLLVAGSLSLVAGVVLERSLDRFLTFSVLVVLLPGYLAIAGSLGGILTNRLSTKVHLGLIESSPIPRGNAREDIGITFTLAFPIFIFLALVGATAGWVVGSTSPGVGLLVAVAASGGFVATFFVAVVAYYGTFAVVRFGLDPDSHGIPLVSAVLDVIGAATLIAALVLWGVA
jgi:mgtE-like transporter